MDDFLFRFITKSHLYSKTNSCTLNNIRLYSSNYFNLCSIVVEVDSLGCRQAGCEGDMLDNLQVVGDHLEDIDGIEDMELDKLGSSSHKSYVWEQVGDEVAELPELDVANAPLRESRLLPPGTCLDRW